MTPARVQYAHDTGRPLKLRPPEANPRTNRCALHLRRLCGTCAKSSCERITDIGTCALDGLGVSGRASARSCEHWERRDG